MSISLNAILFLVGAFQGVVLSLAIFFGGQLRNSSKRILAVFIVILTSQMLLKVISKDWIGNYFSYFGIVAYQIPFLFGPVVFLFAASVATRNWKFKPLYFLHFFPFVFLAILIFLISQGITNQVAYLLPNTLFRQVLFLIIQLTSVCFYGYSAWTLTTSFENNLQSTFSSLARVSVTWLKQFIIASMLTSLITSIALSLMYYFYPLHQEIRYLLLCQGLLIYWITYKAIVDPQLFAFGSLVEVGVKPISVGTSPLKASKKYAHNFLSEEDTNRIKEKVIEKMECGKLFLNANVSIDDFSKATGESRHNISRVINESLKVNFFDFVNGYRVAMAKKLLAQTAMNHYTIAAIAFECGFNSISSFNIVFKKYESLTPSAYKKQKQNQAKTS